jgi:mannose-6-phosphate isomerase
MNFGILSTFELLNLRLHFRWVPKWHQAFLDTAQGGFYERLDHKFKPILTGQRRLLTQCRQLAVYSHAVYTHPGIIDKATLADAFDHICTRYRDEKTGGWFFSVDDKLTPLDTTNDLYALSFVIFACAHYGRVGNDVWAHDVAVATAHFIDRHFRLENHPGFAEALDRDLNIIPKTRRQNPHMHLFEACLVAGALWDDAIFKTLADEMVDLFDRYFYRDGALVEFFNDDLTPHPEQGGRVEPGHYYEWVWLLKKYGSRHDRVCEDLLNWANAHGWDNQFGGIYDVLVPDGNVIEQSKRLWPFTEAIKANALMLDSGFDKVALKQRMLAMLAVFETRYMQERGFWTEWLSRDLMPQTDYMPGTSPYHVYFGITETCRILRGRGRSMSIGIGPAILYYRLRRSLSGLVRGLRSPCP